VNTNVAQQHQKEQDLTYQEKFIGKNPPRFGGTGLIRRFFEKYTQVESVLSCCVVKMQQPDKFTKVVGLV